MFIVERILSRAGSRHEQEVPSGSLPKALYHFGLEYGKLHLLIGLPSTPYLAAGGFYHAPGSLLLCCVLSLSMYPYDITRSDIIT